jgi:hypothetical protein
MRSPEKGRRSGQSLDIKKRPIGSIPGKATPPAHQIEGLDNPLFNLMYIRVPHVPRSLTGLPEGELECPGGVIHADARDARPVRGGGIGYEEESPFVEGTRFRTDQERFLPLVLADNEPLFIFEELSLVLRDPGGEGDGQTIFDRDPENMSRSRIVRHRAAGNGQEKQQWPGQRSHQLHHLEESIHIETFRQRNGGRISSIR